jgi:hypothetical protein
VAEGGAHPVDEIRRDGALPILKDDAGDAAHGYRTRAQEWRQPICV